MRADRAILVGFLDVIYVFPSPSAALGLYNNISFVE